MVQFTLDRAAAGVDAKKIEAERGVVEVTIPLPKEAKNETIAIKPTRRLISVRTRR